MKIFSRLFDNNGSLSQKATRAGVWVFGSFIFTKLLFFVRTIILVRLLMPADFGLMGIALLAISAMQVFTETGLTPALIQKRELSKDMLNTAWVISVSRGILLFILLYLLSPLIASFYNNVEIEPLLKVISFAFLFLGLQNIGIVLFQKELNFKKKAIFTFAIDITSIIFSVIFAFILRNVWALVIGYIAGALIGLVISYQIQSFKPSFKFNVKIAKELFKFGKHVFASGVMIFLITQGDDALVGKVLGMGLLGFYALAYGLSNLPVTGITYIISQVSLPAYSKVQDDLQRLERGYLKVLKFTSFLVIPLAGGIFILAPEFIKVAYGERWLPMIPAVLVMCFLGLFRAIGATMGPVFYAIGKPYILNKIKLFEVILMVLIIYPLTKTFGIVGAAITGTLVYLLSLILHYYNLINIIRDLKIKILKVISKPLYLTLLMIFAIYLLKKHVFVGIYLIQLIVLILFGIVFYFVLSFIFDRDLIKSAREIFSSISCKSKKKN